MGFFDFLRKKNNKVSLEEEQEKVNIENIGNWIGKKEKEIEHRDEEIFALINEKKNLFIEELNEKLEVLEELDVNSKKAEEKIKLIVKENLGNYVYYVKDFLEKLSNLEREKFEKSIKNIDNLLLEFDKRSNISYQKVTFLIGKEIAVVKEDIKNFSKYLIGLYDENKKDIDFSKIISTIKLQFNQFNELNKNIEKINEEIKLIDIKIKEEKENEKRLLEEIERIKETPEYIENLNRQERIESNKKELEREIYRLKELIDFKALSNIFHVDEKRMNIVKSYKENFQAEFQKDNGATILSLLDEIKLDKNKILNKVDEIRKLEKEIAEEKGYIKENGVQELSNKRNKVIHNIESLNNEKTAEEKRQEKLGYNKEEIVKFIKEELKNVGVVFED